jgi:hypothetical protein
MMRDFSPSYFRHSPCAAEEQRVYLEGEKITAQDGAVLYGKAVYSD